MRYIIFSRHFPAYHPRKGDSTWFVEKILSGIGIDHVDKVEAEAQPFINDFALCMEEPKFHTIRAGNRWKVGDYFSPRIWSDKPYRSKQIQFAPPIEIKKTFKFDLYFESYHKASFKVDGIEITTVKKLSANDGLSKADFLDWFKVKSTSQEFRFKGQIICWNEGVNYR